jgi:hypothetical protein
MVFRIQYVSNLNVHKSCLREVINKIDPCASSLALLGDIGIPLCEKTKNFMKWCDAKYKRVYWVPGFLELSVSESKKHTWVERYNMCQESICDWDLKNTTLCSKKDVQEDKLQLLLTTLWHPTEKEIYTHSPSGPKRMDAEDFKAIMNSEFNWILKKSSISGKPVSWMTYSSPYTTQHIAVNIPLHWSTYIHPMLTNNKHVNTRSCLYYPKLVSTIHGHSDLVQSYSGGVPWTGLNMDGHSRFVKGAFWEYSGELK